MSFIGNVPAEAYSPVAKDTFSGNDSTTDFTLSIPATTNSVNVYVENVAQEPTTAYTISGTTLSFTAAPVTGTNNIYVIHRGPAVQQIVPPAGVALNPSDVTATGDISTEGDLKVEVASGGIYTITGTDTATNRTLTLPDEAGTVLTSASSIPSSQITGSLGGLTLIDSGSLAGVTSSYFNDVFSSDYDNYTFFVNVLWSSSGDEDARIRMSNSGSADGSSNYAYSLEYINANLNSGTANASDDDSAFKITDNHDNHTYTAKVDFYNPNKTNYHPQIKFDVQSYDNGYTKWMYGFGRYKATTNFDGFFLYIAGGSGTLTGTYAIYGWNN